ncbi:MAG TPA: dynamin family protein [Chloroflexia bacterium]|nr:dynamin family protein [Chloroflexia bacterium]
MNGKPLLTASQNQVLAAEKDFFEKLQQAVEDFGAAPEDRSLLAKVSAGLDELFLLVVVGEFNSGKSAFINALVGAKVLAEGATPTTSQINVLRFGQQPGQQRREADLLEVFYPAPFLQEISVVDTPGTNAVIERHQALTEEFVPRSDLVIFVTSSERPFTQSERQFLEKVRDWGKKIVVVVNKVDLINSSEDYHKVMQFVADGFRQLLGLEAPIFPVSGRLALQAKMQPGPQFMPLWQNSGFGPLEDYIFRTLDQSSRIRLKFQSPLSVADQLTGRYGEAIGQRLNLLEQDARTVDNIERQLEVYQDDMRRDFEGRLARINNLIYELNERADKFFDEVLKVTRVFELIKTDRIRRDFEQRVVGDTPRRIEQAVQDMVEWTVEREGRTWQEVTAYLRERRQAGGDQELIGSTSNDFERFNYNRRALLQQVGEQARSIMQSFDHRAEAEKLNLSVRDAVARTTLTEIGAVGIGAGLAIVLSSAAADFTGLLLTLVIGGVGFYIIPARRRKAKYEFRQKLESLRGRLTGVLREQFQHEMTVGTERVREAIAPYTRFIRTEREHLGGLSQRFGELRQELSNLQTAIERATPNANIPGTAARNTMLPPEPATLAQPPALQGPAQPDPSRPVQPPQVPASRPGNDDMLFPPSQYEY